MRIENLQYVLEVARAGSISAAAKIYGSAKPHSRPPFRQRKGT